MDDAAVVRGVERVGNLPADLHLVGQGHATVLEAGGERVAFHELEHDRLCTAEFLEAVNGADVRMVERREHLCLAAEPGDPIGVLGKAVGQELERDVAPEPAVARAEHRPHSSGADRRDDLVRTERRTGFEGHRRQESTSVHRGARSVRGDGRSDPATLRHGARGAKRSKALIRRQAIIRIHMRLTLGTPRFGVLAGLTALWAVAIYFQPAGATQERKPAPAPRPPAELLRLSLAAETPGLAEPFKGITANGEIEPHLFAIRSTGVSTAPVRKAAEKFLASLTAPQLKTTSFPAGRRRVAPVDEPELLCTPGRQLPGHDRAAA